MFTLIITITSIGFLWDDKRTVVIDNFKTQTHCEVSGEKYKSENNRGFERVKYSCVKKG